MTSTTRSFLSIADLTPDGVMSTVQTAKRLKDREIAPRPLEGKIIALLFEKPSLRTRVSFEVGIRQLGGECIYLSKDDVGLGIREPVADVARVLDRWVDGIVARVFAHQSLELLAQYTRIPIVNALSDLEHPCQAMGDLLTVLEHRGKLAGQRIAYIGDGNNVAASLALACASVGAHFTIAVPPAPEYQIPAGIWAQAQRRAEESGSRLTVVETPQDAARGAAVVYTDVWVSMGQEKENAVRMKAFAGYQVNPALMALANPTAIFMHDLPAHHGLEVSEGMLDHKNSVVFDQAENRLHAQKAVLLDLFSV